jgi:GWxTD domain-containing protein
MNIMKRTFFKRILIIFVFSCSQIPSYSIVAYINQSLFKLNDHYSYVELHLKIPLSTLSLTQIKNGNYQASVMISIQYLQEDSIHFKNTYYLQSPELKDSNIKDMALLDLKRTRLKNGIYTLRIQIRDEYNNDNSISIIKKVEAHFPGNIISFSDIIYADTIYATNTFSKFSRNNMEVIPNVFNLYPLNHTVFFYAEFYNSDKIVQDENIYIKYYLEGIPESEQIIKSNPVSINYIHGRIDSQRLQAGTYKLIIQLYRANNTIIASKESGFSILRDSILHAGPKEEFMELLKLFDTDQLSEHLLQCSFLCNPLEYENMKNALESKDENLMRSFLLEFWSERNPEAAHLAFNAYQIRIENADKLYGNALVRGYKTERGRVFLSYGPPNKVTESFDGSLTYPYEIWQYYHIPPDQSNKKFVFYNKTGVLNEFELIHSDAKGELSNPNWKEIIKRRDSTKEKEPFGDYLNKDFNE